MATRTKSARAESHRKIVAAIHKHLDGPVVLAGKSYAPAKLASLFQDGIDVADASDSIRQQWLDAVAKERKAIKDLAGLAELLRALVLAQHGAASLVFSDFGFTTRKVPTIDAATKAAAVEKRAATREAKKRRTSGETTPALVTPEKDGT